MECKFVEGYNNRYKINKNGEVYEGDVKIESKIHKTLNIPFVTFIRNGGHSNSHSVARLVWEAFNGKIKDGTKLKYKDNNNCNICLDNLEVINKHIKINDGVEIELDNTKEWKPIRGYEELYKISEFGDVYSIRLNKIISPNLGDKGYYRIVLNKENTKSSKYIHNIVYSSFKNVELNKNKVIDHIDRNKINNHINNLREVTRSENSKNIDIKEKTNFDKILQYSLDKNFIREWKSCKEIIENNPNFKKDHINHCCVGMKKSAYGFIWKYKDFVYDQTGYAEVKTDDGKRYSNYKINQDGIIINLNGRKIKQRKNGYMEIKMISDCGKEKKFVVHRLVAITFIPNPYNKPIVNHLDENKMNNNMDNLEWTTHQGNSHHSLAKKVHQIDIETSKIINTYDSIKSAQIAIGKPNNWNIGLVCSGKYKQSYGYKWKFVE
ncbi:HNH endonuclease with NUMOD4 motif and intron encoded nuclease repeat [Fadolivirus algeromassiliense]|jgi:hypothetical protein|uniref:HNH endonuclease with NUMOD4 motif and intron encoded nuclease repeat n=1 Tax=Fadolivirus FV1/VV64 TaxID=3070911 RepID=A0A7D3UQR0_9VIRU|nr:HNH endonuclease with NUMOD4 motif and intron encoded nuclease repeat [Fadolivirus algeromassiliense]QKF94013.1 HNH endonuclease with NUMOD4 motif and intron encoded nuclease repeat [Fadolivirus FV1/VV64]